MTRTIDKIQFYVKPKPGGKPFSLERPNFLAGTYGCEDDRAPVLKEQHRSGDASIILRPSFMEDSIKPRTVTFDGDEIKPVKQSVLVGNYINVRDPTDTAWIEEEKRMRKELTVILKNTGKTDEEIKALVTKELEINKPLGRDQKMMRKLSEDIQEEKNIRANEKFLEILQEVKDGRAESLKAKQDITAQLLKILSEITMNSNDVLQLERTIQNNQVDIITTLARLNLPSTSIGFGMDMDICGVKYFKENSSKILLYLITKATKEAKGDYDAVRPVKGSTPGSKSLQVSSFITKIGYKQADNKDKIFLDITNATAMTRKQVIEALEQSKKMGSVIRYNLSFTEEIFSADPVVAAKQRKLLEINNIDITDNADLDTSMGFSSSVMSSSSSSSSSSSPVKMTIP